MKMATPKTLRFWVKHMGSLVKIELQPGQCFCSCSNIIWHDEGHRYSFMEFYRPTGFDEVEIISVIGGHDCDGHSYTETTYIGRISSMHFELGNTKPGLTWTRSDVRVFDQFAQMAGY